MLRTRQKFGKYIIERRLGEGGFAVVYQARDTIEGIRVALKVPYGHLMTDEALEAFRHEVRVVASLDHPNILPLKYADYIEGHFVIVTALGDETLQERLQRRMSIDTALDFTEQMLAAVAHAHEHRIIHCDIKPDNFLIFPENVLRLTDFGIARVALRTLRGSGAGTVGYIAPEQAMGRPSFRSDVFSLGLILYRMLTGHLPEWPFEWPPPGYNRLKRRVHPDMINLIRKSLEINAARRYRSVIQMEGVYHRIRDPGNQRQQLRDRNGHATENQKTDWRRVRYRQFQREHKRSLETHLHCQHCSGPVAESMFNCPWCGKRHQMLPDTTNFPIQCPRCFRGMKPDWRYCAWCYGEGFEPLTNRQVRDRRYIAKCSNRQCDRKDLMAFMRYCPWCRRRAGQDWPIIGSPDRCKRCKWGVLNSYWNYCPWCAKRIHH